jgi:DinB superfamily
MDYMQSFTTLLQSSTDMLLWTVQQIPEDLFYTISPKRPERWPVARHVMHLQYNEGQVVLPCMRRWLDEEYAIHYKDADDKKIERYGAYEMLVHDEEIAWQQTPAIATWQEKFREGRKAQIALLTQFAPAAWEETRETVWGQVTLRWAITKTYQHTLEHSNDILKYGLYRARLRVHRQS